jgi:hypothetical protein
MLNLDSADATGLPAAPPLTAPPGGTRPRPPVTVGDYFMRLMDMRQRATRLITAIEDELQDMVDRLDTIDGDPDLEPWLSGSDACRLGYALDAEIDADDEPSLGAPERTPPIGGFGMGRARAFSQTHWCQGSGFCEEEEIDEDGNDEQREGDGCTSEQSTIDDEPDNEGEPWLGATLDTDQDLAWSDRTSGWCVMDGEAEGTTDDLDLGHISNEVREAQRRVRSDTEAGLRRRLDSPLAGRFDPDAVYPYLHQSGVMIIGGAS